MFHPQRNWKCLLPPVFRRSLDLVFHPQRNWKYASPGLYRFVPYGFILKGIERSVEDGWTDEGVNDRFHPQRNWKSYILKLYVTLPFLVSSSKELKAIRSAYLHAVITFSVSSSKELKDWGMYRMPLHRSPVSSSKELKDYRSSKLC